MYSQRIVAIRLDQIAQKLGLRPKRRSFDEISAFCKLLTDHTDEKGELKLKLTDFHREIVRDEQILCRVDFRYWAERYGTILRDGIEGGGIGKIKFWASQEEALRILASIEEKNYEAHQSGFPVDGIRCCFHKARQLGACLGKGSRVLMADLSWVPIESVRPGDRVVSLDEEIKGGKGSARKMRTATVTGCCTMTVPTYRVVLDDGTTLTATPHHRFLYKGSRGYSWCEVRDMCVGGLIRRVVRPWGEPSYEDGWFAGILDGEGSVRAKRSGGAELTVSQVPGPVLERAAKYLSDHGCDFRTEVDRREPGTSKLGPKEVYKLVVNRMGDMFSLLGSTRPSRFADMEWWDGKELPNGSIWAKVVHVGPSLDMPVYDIETTTGTYVAEGLASHNTMFSRLLTMHRLTTHDHHRAMAASVDEDKIQELYDRDKLILEELPFYLRPSVGFDVKASHLYFDRLNSRVLYQQSSQKSGLGQGRQFELAHLTECSSWAYPKMIEFDFFPTLPLGPNTLCMLESTANGRGNWWHEFTEDVRKGNRRGWHYIFTPWYIEDRKYRAMPPSNWMPSESTLEHAKKVYETSKEFTGRDVLLSREQLYWYETERDAARRANSLNLFLTNYCATPEESFQHTTAAQFNIETMERVRLQTRKPACYEAA